MPAGLRIGRARGSAASLTILVPAGAGGTFFSRPSQQRGDQARPGRVVSLLCSPRAYPHMPSAKSQGPAPSPWWERRLLRGRCAGGAGGNVCSQSTTSFRFTELTRTAVCFPHRSPAQRQRPSDSGTVLSVVTRGPLPAVRPGPRSPGCPRGPPHQQTRCVPPTPRHGPPLASQPPPGTNPICCSSQQNSSERMLRVSSDYLTAQFRPSFHPPLRPPTTAISSTPGTLSIPPLA